MANFIAISGPSASGKTELYNELMRQDILSDAVFLPDIFHTVWESLVDQGLLLELEDINKDAEILCVFIQRVITYYRDCIDKYKDTDRVVIIDSCWLDLSIYATLNMWYTHILKEVQESLLSQLSIYDKSIDRIYITQYDDSKNTVPKYRSQFKRYNVKFNRPLEIQYYELGSNLKNAIALPTSDISEAVEYILEDIIELGYL